MHTPTSMRNKLISSMICYNPYTFKICSNNIPSISNFRVYDILVSARNVTSIIHEAYRQNLFWAFELWSESFFFSYFKTNVIWNFKLFLFALPIFLKMKKRILFFFCFFSLLFFLFYSVAVIREVYNQKRKLLHCMKRRKLNTA